jgi:hypothetical protein
MRVFPLLLLISLIGIGIIMIKETFFISYEGFTGTLPELSYWSSFVAPRSDIGPTQEEPTYVRDPRYFNEYVDVSRLGLSYDFCRMVAAKDETSNLFFACALAGTENLDSVKFRTPGTKDGFRISYDDYMRDVNNDGRSDYCRILTWKDGSYQPVCSYSSDIGFESSENIDPNPPDDIVKLLQFYDGCVLWLRFKNDMIDTVKSVKCNIAGGLVIDETVRKQSEGLKFNGINQFLRISDSSDLSLGNIVPLRSTRSWMVWVYFDEFTNNAKIFDFGNGAGKDNVFLGILGKGETTLSESDLKPLLCGDESTVPTGKSGQQPVSEVSPKELMETSDANVDKYVCTGPDVKNDTATHAFLKEPTEVVTGRAALLYEVWDKQSRKMRIKVNNAIPLKKWTHITITTTSNIAFRPDVAVYINAKKVFEQPSGWLPATSSMTNCYIGKSNWASSVSQYENRDELFKGRLFDFRAYKITLNENVIKNSHDWGKNILAV